MKERLIQLLDVEQLNSSKFADIIGVQRSSVSHVLSGRNKPSFDFLQKTLNAFPGLRADWLIQGQGGMYEHMQHAHPGGLFDEPVATRVADQHEEKELKQPVADEDGVLKTLSGTETTESAGTSGAQDARAHTLRDPKSHETTEPGDGTKKRVVQVIVMYDDDTFSSYSPSE